MIFYFSGCGNSQWVAESLAEKLQQSFAFIPKAETSHCLPEGEPIGFVFPVYAWAPPRLVLDFVKHLRITQPGRHYVFSVVTCGDDAGLTDRIFAKHVQKYLGMEVNASFSIQMPETYINLPGFQLDTQEGVDRKVTAARTRLDSIASQLLARQQATDVIVGSSAWLKSHPVCALFNGILISDRPFRVMDSCIGCGVCQKSCPVGNIILDSTTHRPVWQHQCVGCMGCYHHCPQNAIHFGKQTLGKGQYYFGKE